MSMSWLPNGRAVHAGAALAILGLGGPFPAFADEIVAAPDVLSATLTCEPLAAPGRLRCDVEARGHVGVLRWVDVEVVKVPKFIAPLRGRVGPREASTHEDSLWRWSLGLLVRERDAGDVTVRVRAVVCEGDTCTPQIALAVAHVAIGP